MHIYSSFLVIFASFSAAILPARAASGEVLTIYTYESFVAEWGPGPAVQEAFEKSCDCSVKWVALGDGVAVLNRLKLEGKAGKADLVLGLDTNLTSEAASTGLFQPHGLELPETTIPGGYRDEIFVPFDHGFFAVVYDSEVIDTPPSSLKELVEGDPEQKIVIQDPRSSTPGLGLVLWVRKVYGDDAPAAWEKLKDRVLTVTPGWSEAYGLFTDGEAPMVLSYTTSPAYHMIEEDSERYRAAAFDEGHYQQIEVAGITAMTDQKQLAQDFLKFMAGPEFQDVIPTKNWMLPAFAVKEALPAAFDTLVEPSQALSFPADEIEDNRKAWIDEWLAVMSR